MTRRIPKLAATAALFGGIAAAGVAAAQDGPRGGPMMMMMGGHGGLDFVAIDTDHNGSLSRAELTARATARLAKADANGDGALDRDEIIVALSGSEVRLFGVFSTDPAEGFADRMLAMMGATETGRVEVAALADRRVNALLAIADTDRDAAISQAEADAMQAERQAWMERGHDRHARGDDRDGRHGNRPDNQPDAAPPAPEAPAE